MDNSGTVYVCTTDEHEVPVPGYLLHAHSAVFADMMTDTPKLSGEKSRIELDLTKAQADKLVRVMAGSETLDFETLDEANQFLKICRQLNMGILATAALGRLLAFAPISPMRVFSIASHGTISPWPNQLF